MKNPGLPEKQGLYDPQFEHDACGVGFVVNMKGKKSHEIIDQAITILINLDHRGACGCETNTGDGAGILMQTPHKFMAKVAGKLNITLPEEGQYAVGMLFTSPDKAMRAAGQKVFERIAKEQGQSVLGWRDIPVDNSMLGETAVGAEPFMMQVFVARGANCADDMAFERQLYIIRKRATNEIRRAGVDNHWYVSSLSCRTGIYKGMLNTEQVNKYYPDLHDPDMETARALVH